MVMGRDVQLTGLGIYTRSDAAKLIEASWSKTNYWIRGYTFPLIAGRVGEKGPIISGEVIEIDDELYITFLQLIELKIVRYFSERGVHLSKIRNTRKELHDKYDISHPFAYLNILQRLRTDRVKIYNDDPLLGLLDLTGSRQYQMRRIVERYLERIDFGDDDLASCLWPLGKDFPVVLDPQRSFGEPICSISGVPTYVPWESSKLKYTPSEIAEWYSMETIEVEAAIKFEKKYKYST